MSQTTISESAPSQAQLAVIVHALDALRLLFRLAKRRQEHGCQDPDDRDDDEQFDQGEPAERGPSMRKGFHFQCSHVFCSLFTPYWERIWRKLRGSFENRGQVETEVANWPEPAWPPFGFLPARERARRE